MRQFFLHKKQPFKKAVGGVASTYRVLWHYGETAASVSLLFVARAIVVLARSALLNVHE